MYEIWYKLKINNNNLWNEKSVKLFLNKYVFKRFFEIFQSFTNDFSFLSSLHVKMVATSDSYTPSKIMVWFKFMIQISSIPYQKCLYTTPVWYNKIVSLTSNGSVWAACLHSELQATQILKLDFRETE